MTKFIGPILLLTILLSAYSYIGYKVYVVDNSNTYYCDVITK